MNKENWFGPAVSRRAALAATAVVPLFAVGANSGGTVALSEDGGIVDGRFFRMRSAAYRNTSILTCEKLKNTNGASIGLAKWENSLDQIIMAKAFTDGSISILFPMKMFGERHALPRQFMAVDIYWKTFKAQLWQPNSSQAQRFIPVRTPVGSYELVSCYQTDKCLTAFDEGGSVVVGISERTSIPAQSWFFEEFGNVELFSGSTESTRFSGLETFVDCEDHNPEITASDCRYSRTDRLADYSAYWDGCGGKWLKFFEVDARSSIEVIYRTVGTYYGEKIGARLSIASILPYSEGRYNGGVPDIGVCDVFSGQDPAGIAIHNIQSITLGVSFFYSDDVDRTPIDIDWCYWSNESLSNGEFYWEWAKPLRGWTGNAYCLSDSYEKFGQPSMISLSLSSIYGGVDDCFTGLLADKTETYEFNSVTLPFSGRNLSMQVGCARTKIDNDEAWGNLISTRFRSLSKTEKTPVHFLVFDPYVAAHDPSYAPSEVYQEGVQKGTVVNLSSDIVKKATKALMVAYPGAATDDDYWWSSREFKDRFNTVTVKSDAVYIWAKLSLGKVEYYSDGVGWRQLVYTDANVRAGSYSIPDKATDAALADTCNLDADFGKDPSTGFTGWFADPGLTVEAKDLVVRAGETLKLYGRNRLTLRCAFTDDSVDISSYILRKSPSSTAPTAEAWSLPDFGLSDEAHAHDGIDLPPIGDDGPGHKALYLGESVTLPIPSGKVYAHLDDGSWAGFRAVTWLGSQQSADAASSFTPSRDTCVYMRVVRADYEGVASTKK